MANKRTFKQVTSVLGIFVMVIGGCGGSATSSAGSSGGASGPASGGSGGDQISSSMKQVQIMDPMFNMVAYTLQIPSNWNFQGIVLHGPGCTTFWQSIAYRASSPDMSYGVQVIPATDFYWADDARARPQGASCKILPPMTAANYGSLVSIHMRPGSEVDGVDEPPNFAQFKELIQRDNQTLAQNAAAVGNRNPEREAGDEARLRIHYDLNGHPEEEWVTVALRMWHQPTSTMMNQPGKLMQLAMLDRIQSSPTVVAQRAPKGQLESHAQLFQTIGASLKANPEYNARVGQWMQNATNKLIARSWQTTNAILKEGQQDQERRTQQAQQFIQNMQAQGDARNAAFAQQMADKSAGVQGFNAQMDRRSAHAQDVSDYLLDQQYYVNPTTGETSYASNQYNNTYTNGSNSSNNTQTLQTNDPNFNPNGVISGNWTQLQAIHH